VSEADKSGVAEPEESVIREGQTADAEESGIRGWYRGDLNGAYQEWREGGKPQDPAHPLTKKLLYQADLFAGRMFSKHIQSYHVLWYDDSRVRVEQANERSIQRAISGAQQQFTAGEIVACDTAQNGSTLTLEVGGDFTLYFLVERSVFEACCKWISRGNAG
jgi:hypothetical protein